jgi:transcriptional regulator with XRE-family HTH domain
MGEKRFSDEIREAIAGAPLSRYEICKRIGFNEGAMSRFMAGRSGISMETLDKLAALLGLTVAAKGRGRKGG